jgi:hypothetical protein
LDADARDFSESPLWNSCKIIPEERLGNELACFTLVLRHAYLDASL